MEPVGRQGPLTAARLAARLHQITSGFSIGLGYLSEPGNGAASYPAGGNAIAVLEVTLKDLKLLAREVSDVDVGQDQDLIEALNDEAGLFSLHPGLRLSSAGL